MNIDLEQLFIGMLVLMDRYLDSYNSDWLHDYNIHRLLLTCLILSVKLNMEASFMNADFAEAVQLDIKEVNGMEKFFLNVIDFKTHISFEEYVEIRQLLHSESSYRKLPSCKKQELWIEKVSRILGFYLNFTLSNLILDYLMTPFIDWVAEPQSKQLVNNRRHSR